MSTEHVQDESYIIRICTYEESRSDTFTPSCASSSFSGISTPSFHAKHFLNFPLIENPLVLLWHMWTSPRLLRKLRANTLSNTIANYTIALAETRWLSSESDFYDRRVFHKSSSTPLEWRGFGRIMRYKPTDIPHRGLRGKVVDMNYNWKYRKSTHVQLNVTVSKNLIMHVCEQASIGWPTTYNTPKNQSTCAFSPSSFSSHRLAQRLRTNAAPTNTTECFTPPPKLAPFIDP